AARPEGVWTRPQNTSAGQATKLSAVTASTRPRASGGGITLAPRDASQAARISPATRKRVPVKNSGGTTASAILAGNQVSPQIRLIASKARYAVRGAMRARDYTDSIRAPRAHGGGA